jgi:hypothetical protein
MDEYVELGASLLCLLLDLWILWASAGALVGVWGG